LRSCFLSKNLNIKIYIIPIVLYGCETWSVTLREEHRLRIYENRELRRIFGTTRRKWKQLEEDCIMRRFIASMLHQILLG
jgi:hypothetical protein